MAAQYLIRIQETPRAARWRALGALLLATTIGSGCYHYVPIEAQSAQADEEVRVRVTDSAAVRLVKEFGGYTGLLEGQLADGPSDSLALSIMIGRAYRGVSLDQMRQTLYLGRTEVVQVQRRQLSRGRTALTTAGVLVVFGVFVKSVVLQGDPNPIDDSNPPPPPPLSGARRWYIRIPIP
ncbi:MAG: hypothetical protein ACREMA_00705 [Longimicrobiales bacterium]